MNNERKIQQYKIDKVEKIKKDFFETDSKDLIFTDYRGLSVEKITELRKKLAEVSSKYVVIKNNYVKVIAKEKGYPEFGDALKGPTGVAFVSKDANEVAKVLFDFSKDSGDILKVKGGFVGDKIFSIKKLEALSKLPGRSQLIATLMATMNAPVQNFVLCCNDVTTRLVRVLDQIKKQKETA